MSVRADKTVYVPPADLAALHDFVADKPGDWCVIDRDEMFGTYTLHMDMGDSIAVCRVQVDTEPLFDANIEAEKASHGRRFRDSEIAARVPLHLMFSPELKEVGKAMVEGDVSYVKKILNDPDFKKLRTLRGRI